MIFLWVNVTLENTQTWTFFPHYIYIYICMYRYIYIHTYIYICIYPPACGRASRAQGFCVACQMPIAICQFAFANCQLAPSPYPLPGVPDPIPYGTGARWQTRWKASCCQPLAPSVSLNGQVASLSGQVVPRSPILVPR